MDSHLIYTVAKRLIGHVVWQESNDKGDDLKTDLLTESINNHFLDEKIYLVHDRKKTCELDKVNSITTIASTIDKRDFSLWSLVLRK